MGRATTTTTTTNKNSSKIHCCCFSFQAEHGAWWVAVVGMHLTALIFLSIMLYSTLYWVEAVGLGLNFLANFLILRALRTKRSIFYLPYLVIHSFIAIFWTFVMVSLGQTLYPAIKISCSDLNGGSGGDNDGQLMNNNYSRGDYTQPQLSPFLHNTATTLHTTLQIPDPSFCISLILIIACFCVPIVAVYAVFILWPMWVVWRAFRDTKAATTNYFLRNFDYGGKGALHTASVCKSEIAAAPYV